MIAAKDWCAADKSKKLDIVAGTNYLNDMITLHKEVLGYKNYEPSSKVKEIADKLAGYQKPVEDSTTTETSGNETTTETSEN